MSGSAILFEILGGVALLLWGCRMVRTGVMRAFGSQLLGFLGRWVGSRPRAVAVGTIVGTALQSSTATALLVAPIVAQGVMLTPKALTIMLGADLGSAIAALVFSSGVSVAWPALAFLGYALHVGFGERSIRMKHIGRIMIGLGLLFLGLRTVGAAAVDLSASPAILGLIEAAAREPLLFILVGAALTWVSYSSIAVVLFATALTAVSGVSAEHLFPLILGVNFGAALPAMVSTIGEAPAARRIPLGNLLFRVTGVAIAWLLLGPIAALIGGLGLNAPTQLILFHLGLNAALIVVFVGLVDPASWLVFKILPDRAPASGSEGARHLDNSLLRTPPAALAAASREALRMGEILEEMLIRTMDGLIANSPSLTARVEADEMRLDTLNESVKIYLTRLMSDELGSDDTRRAVENVTYTTNLEQVGDIIDKNLLELGRKKARLQVQFSEQGLRDLKELHVRVMDTLKLSISVFMTGHLESARALLLRKTEFRDLELEAADRHIERLRAGKFESMLTSSIHLDVIRDFKRINSHLTSIAYPVLEHTGELRESRLTKQAFERAQARASENREPEK